MSKEISKSFESYFGGLKDPRIERTKFCPLSEILVVVLSGSICGASSWRDFVLFGKGRLEFLQEYYAFEKGIPSKNTFARVFAARTLMIILSNRVARACSIKSNLLNLFENLAALRRRHCG